MVGGVSFCFFLGAGSAVCQAKEGGPFPQTHTLAPLAEVEQAEFQQVQLTHTEYGVFRTLDAPLQSIKKILQACLTLGWVRQDD